MVALVWQADRFFRGGLHQIVLVELADGLVHRLGSDLGVREQITAEVVEQVAHHRRFNARTYVRMRSFSEILNQNFSFGEHRGPPSTRYAPSSKPGSDSTIALRGTTTIISSAFNCSTVCWSLSSNFVVSA